MNLQTQNSDKFKVKFDKKGTLFLSKDLADDMEIEEKKFVTFIKGNQNEIIAKFRKHSQDGCVKIRNVGSQYFCTAPFLLEAMGIHLSKMHKSQLKSIAFTRLNNNDEFVAHYKVTLS